MPWVCSICPVMKPVIQPKVVLMASLISCRGRRITAPMTVHMVPMAFCRPREAETIQDVNDCHFAEIPVAKADHMLENQPVKPDQACLTLPMEFWKTPVIPLHELVRKPATFCQDVCTQDVKPAHILRPVSVLVFQSTLP